MSTLSNHNTTEMKCTLPGRPRLKRHPLILEGPFISLTHPPSLFFSLFLSCSLALPFSHSPGRLASHKVGWCLRIMAAEGRGSGHLANAAPICFYERGEEFSEDTTLTRTTRSAAKIGRLKIKLVNILPVSPCDAHFSVQELIAAAIYITKT